MEKYNYNFEMNSHKYSLIKEIILVMESSTYDFKWDEIMDITIKFTIGNSSINGGSIPMEYNMLLCKLLRKHIKRKNNIVEIRCAFFELLKNNFLNCSKFKNLDGFLFSCISCQEMSVAVITETKNLNFKLKIKN